MDLVQGGEGFVGPRDRGARVPMPLILLPFLGSGFVPTDSMLAGIRWFAEYQPFTPFIETLRGLLMDADRKRRAAVRRMVRGDHVRRIPVGHEALQPGTFTLMRRTSPRVTVAPDVENGRSAPTYS